MQYPWNRVSSSFLLASVVACKPASGGADMDMEVMPEMSFDEPRSLLAFDGPGHNPEGLVVSGSRMFVGLAPLGEVVRIDATGSEPVPFGAVPAPVPEQGFLTGLEVAPDGSVLAALASFVPEPAAGIYRLPPQGGPGELLASHDSSAFPNAMTYADDGALYYTDSAAGAVFVVPASGGPARVWIRDPLLEPRKDSCGEGVDAFEVGANGLVIHEESLYVANTTQATIVRIPMEGEAAGAAEIFAGPDCEVLGGADDLLVLEEEQSLVVAANRLDHVAVVELEGAQAGTARVVAHVGLDFPASVAISPAGELLVTNAGFLSGEQARPGVSVIAFGRP